MQKETLSQKKFISSNPQETSTIAGEFLNLLKTREVEGSEKNATILTLKGNLGAGKTTFTQALGRYLEVTDTMISPTFVIAKFYDTPNTSPYFNIFEKLVHVDAYRLESSQEIMSLGFKEMIEQPKTLIVIEWPEIIPEALVKAKENLPRNFFEMEIVIKKKNTKEAEGGEEFREIKITYSP